MKWDIIKIVKILLLAALVTVLAVVIGYIISVLIITLSKLIEVVYWSDAIYKIVCLAVIICVSIVCLTVMACFALSVIKSCKIQEQNDTENFEKLTKKYLVKVLVVIIWIIALNKVIILKLTWILNIIVMTIRLSPKKNK